MQYQVPQFIETKTRILGPFTLEQSAYIVIGAILEFIIQYTLTGSIRLVFTVVIAALTLLFAYGSVSGMSFPQYLLRGVLYFFSPRRYLYHKEKASEQDIVDQITSSIPKRK